MRNKNNLEYYPYPTLLEAMDWLEERGIGIEIEFYSLDKTWHSNVRKIHEEDMGKSGGSSIDRNDCMQKAIEKALEVLSEWKR